MKQGSMRIKIQLARGELGILLDALGDMLDQRDSLSNADEVDALADRLQRARTQLDEFNKRDAAVRRAKASG